MKFTQSIEKHKRTERKTFPLCSFPYLNSPIEFTCSEQSYPQTVQLLHV